MTHGSYQETRRKRRSKINRHSIVSQKQFQKRRTQGNAKQVLSVMSPLNTWKESPMQLNITELPGQPEISLPSATIPSVQQQLWDNTWGHSSHPFSVFIWFYISSQTLHKIPYMSDATEDLCSLSPPCPLAYGDSPWRTSPPSSFWRVRDLLVRF